ncbi:unnamed protein product [Acanthoscelides obtectus]|uniref:Uncharacterized protein n=1 Tax=Acanthoscelides obtectus TaxID=200917 RepID=A0A9P0KAV7_ACAOB|nr:unnamed protein product [Acanthoscelides obtectus]CAK1666856.1 Leucine-rich repeat neuronal protein 1 [Acanthoscelides obtectus]
MKLIVIITFIYLCSADGVFQNSSHICDTCNCHETENEFILNCVDKRFTHVLADWPHHNKSLIADFSYNNISTLEKLPTSNYSVRLMFDHCNIKSLEPGILVNVVKVELLDLSYNLLTTEKIDGIDFKGPYVKEKYFPTALKHLNLAYNLIHTLPEKLFESMPHLEDLNLAGNGFSVLDFNSQHALSSLSKLKRLNLSNNGLTELVGDAVRNLTDLEELDLSYNKLDFVPNTLDYLKKNLKVLDLSNNPIYKLNDKSFLGLNLKYLYLNNLPRVKAVGPNTFATLPMLKKLEMCNNIHLRDIDREAFSPKQELVELYLNNNSLVEISYHLLQWKTLEIFEIMENPLSCTCDLYNISRDLKKDITRNLDGPSCVHSNGNGQMIYRLKEASVCTGKCAERQPVMSQTYWGLLSSSSYGMRINISLANHCHMILTSITQKNISKC